MERVDGMLQGLTVAIVRGQQWASLAIDERTRVMPRQVRQGIEFLREFVPNGRVTMDISAVWCPSGQDLLDLVAALRTELQPGEVEQ